MKRCLWRENLGVAFQLANFIRDVGEDLQRGRVYLPLQELKHFGVSRKMLAERKLTPQVIEALKFQINRVRELQAKANTGICPAKSRGTSLHRSSQRTLLWNR